MSAFTISVTMEGEDQPTSFQVKPRTVLAFERHFKIGMNKAFQVDQKLEHIYWLGWDAMRSAGNVVKPFETWLESVEDVRIVPKDEDDQQP